MPHQCVNCSVIYSDDAPEMISGCSCGAKAFFFIRNMAKLDAVTEELRESIIEQSPDEPVVLDLENIRVTDGKYELDLHALFGKREIIFQHDEGKYTIDLEESFRRHAEK
jgi:predicted  nucleic acid-binding Zn-ribbon protein